MKAHSPTGLCIFKPLLEHRTIVQVKEVTGRDREGCLALAILVVEKKKTGFQILEVDLIANHLDMVISQKRLSRRPGLTARALFEVHLLP